MAIGGKRLSEDPALRNLLSALEQVRRKVDGKEEDCSFLREILQSRSLQALVHIHNRIITCEAQGCSPSSQNAAALSNEILEDLKSSEHPEVQELCQILSTPHFKAFLDSHDQVAAKAYIPLLADLSHEADEEEETVKIVQLVKSNEPLGATIRYNESSGTIVIARIMHGGAADRSGLIHVGDEVHEVNGISVKGKTPHDVVSILEQTRDGTISFKLVPGEDLIPARESRVRVRAHFDFDPSEDSMIPCKEAGLAFRKGDILHVVNQEDPNWWQARKEGEKNSRAGLIPGRQLQERRFAAMRDLASQQDEEIFPGCPSPVRKDCIPRKIKKIMYDAKENDDFDHEEIATYEEVAKLYPRPGLHRPTILIGPPGVGRNELKRRLINTDPDCFRATIPHTSRPRKPWETDGKEYFFVSREYMEEEIRQGRFVEYGEYKGNLYGTSVETIRSIANAGYMCVMNPHPQALKMLRTPEFKPYIIFIKPPSFEKLRETRICANARSTFDENLSRGFTNEEFQDIIYSARKMEYVYGHMFDTTIVNDDLQRAFQELLEVVTRVETEPQWVPASWVASS